ncbi:Peroxisomal 2,4-dienoyl-CoA reductase [(3E)-enoyl-CoA-producing] [Balamuthia mandrillaris]
MASQSPFKGDVLRGQVALITGGATGIGFGITRALGLHGAKVAITGRRAEKLAEAVESLKKDGIEALGLAGDVRKPDEVESVVKRVVETFGKLSIVVNCAAGNFLCPAEELSYNAFKTVVDIDLNGSFNVSRACFPALKKSGNGCIINISATLHYGATQWQLHPSAAKAGVDALTRGLGVEWGRFGIRVNGIAPGPVQGTEGLERLSAMAFKDPSWTANVASAIPVGRMGTVEDIGLTAVFLASPAASWITGHTMVVDGGSWLYAEPRVSREQLTQITALLKSRPAKSAQKAAL